MDMKIKLFILIFHLTKNCIKSLFNVDGDGEHKSIKFKTTYGYFMSIEDVQYIYLYKDGEYLERF